MVAMQTAPAGNTRNVDPAADPVQPSSLEKSSLSESSLRASGLEEVRNLRDRSTTAPSTIALSPAVAVSSSALTTEERNQAQLVISQVRQLAREEGLALQKRATGAESERVPALDERLKKEGITVSLERLKSDATVSQALAGAREAGNQEGRRQWTDANQTAAKLYGAMQGWGTDEAAVFKALEGKSPDEIKAIREAYKANYRSDLDTRLAEEMSGSDLDRARDLMLGDPKMAAAAELYWSMKGAGTDEAAISHVLSRPDAADVERIFNERYASKYGVSSLREALKSELGGDHLRQAENLVSAANSSLSADERADAKARADAAELHYAMKGFGGMGTDEGTLHRILGNNLDTQQLERLSTAYRAEYGVELRTHLEGELSFNDRARALHLLDGDKVGADVAALKSAEWGWGIDRNGVRAVLENTTDAHRAAVLERYRIEQGQSLEESVKGQVSKDAQTVIGALAARGKLSDAEELLNSMVGLGTDEALLLKHIEGKSKAEIAQIRQEYQKLSGRDLDNDINWEVSGQYQFDATAALRGKPETIDEIYQAMEERHAYERSGIDFFTDCWSDQGKVLDRQMALARDRMDRIKNGRESATDKEDLIGLYDVQNVHAKAFREAKDVVVNNLATVATVAVATTSVVVSGGLALGFWATIAVSTGVAAGARVGTKVALKGARYDWGGELAADVGIAALEAGTAKLGMAVSSALSKTRVMTQLGGRGITGRAAAAAIDGAADGVGSGAVSGVGENLLTTDFSGKSVGEIVQSVGVSGSLGAIGGGLGSAGMGSGLSAGLDKFTGRAARAFAEDAGSPVVTRVLKEDAHEVLTDAAQDASLKGTSLPDSTVAPEAVPRVDSPAVRPDPELDRVLVRTVDGLKVGNLPRESSEHAFENILAKLSRLNGGRMNQTVDVLSFASLVSDPDTARWLKNMDSDLRKQLTDALTNKKLTGDMLLDALAQSSSKLNHGQALVMDYLSNVMPFERVRGVEITLSPGKTFVLENEIGSGGFGKVIQARQVSVGVNGERVLGDPVALKVTQVLKAEDLDAEIAIPQDMVLSGSGLRSSRPIDAVRFNAPELTIDGIKTDVGIVVMDLIEGQDLYHFLDKSFEATRDAATAAGVLSQLARDYDELHRRGWGVTDAHGGNVMISPGRSDNPAQLFHIDRAGVVGPNSGEVFSAQMDHLEKIAGDAVTSWRRANPGMPEPLHIELMRQIQEGIRLGNMQDFQEIAGVFQRMSQALAEPNGRWSRQQLRGIQADLDALGISRGGTRQFAAPETEFSTERP